MRGFTALVASATFIAATVAAIMSAAGGNWVGAIGLAVVAALALFAADQVFR